MKILVTGSSGFVGKCLCKKLKELNYDIVKTGLTNVEPFSQSARNCDLTNLSECKTLFNYYKPEVVIHLAAKCGGIGANQENPGIFMRDNLWMGLNVINCALWYNIKKFIMLGSVCAYPKFAKIPFKEEDLWNGYPEETNAPYGIAKKTLMELIISYNKQWNFNGINLIPVNMYGPEDNFNPEYSHVIPAIILKVYRAIIKGENKINVWGSGNVSREFLYVEDCVQAIILALEKENIDPQPINIGTGKEIKIHRLVDIICEKVGYDGRIDFDSSKPDGQPRRCLDITRAKKILEYKPKVNLDIGLNKTIEWFLQNKEQFIEYLNRIY